MLIKRFALSICLLLWLGFVSQSAAAQERLCDTAFEDCRQPLWTLIDNEQMGIDVALWFIQDTSVSNKIIARHNAGVRVRILVDPRANPTYSGNEAILNQLRNAGIPMRFKVGGGILHWKMMLFEGQNKLEFSGANFGPFFFVPSIPFQDYIDEAIYFTDDPSVVNSFKTKYDDLWTDTANYANYGNITSAPTRHYPTFPIDPELNFPPSADGSEDFYNRTAFYMNQENQKIDIIMYRHTNDRYTARTVEARERGVPVRMITEQQEYRNLARQWDAYNIDLLYNAGVQIKIRNHQGLNHEKAVLLYGQGRTIFGSSNWTGPSSNSQAEHNYFTTKPWFFNWFVNHFDRKWNSNETAPFTPLPPDSPSLLSPSDGAASQPTTNMVLSWEGGPWAHKFDIYFGTTTNPPLLATDQFIGRVDDGVVERYTLQQTLTPGTTYYWRIVSKTMANVTASGPVWRFTTAGVPPNPGPAPTVTSISPNTGSTGGGTFVTITGTNFQTGATVRIGGSPASSVNVVNSTSINAVTPAHSAGAVDVVVTNPDTQSGTLSNGFTYTQPPPPPPGATDIVLYASEATKVGNWQVVSDATAAGGARIHNPDAGAPKRATALANPADYFEMTFNVQANTAYRLWIRGKAQNDQWANDSIFIQFSGSVTSSQAATYRIGTTSATEMNLEDCSGCGVQGWGWQDNGWGVGVLGPQIYFQTTGSQTLRVQVREDGLLIDQIVLSPTTYLSSSPGALKNDATILPRSGPPSPAPTVSNVSPASGPTTGSTAVTITGTGFQAGAGVTFGGTAATNVVVTNATQITASTPAHAAGGVNVVVTNSDGQSGTLANGFTYNTPPPPPAPTVTGVSPSSGPTAGGTAVTVTGTGFLSGAGVTFGGTAATNVIVTSATQITASTPAHAAGGVNVVVTNSDGQSSTLTNGFTYTTPPPPPAPTVSNISPTSGPTTGGTAVTITGTGFQSGASVRFGGTAATNVVVTNATHITATTPSHTAGAVDVVVTNSDGQPGTLSNGFTYTQPPPTPAPTVSSVSPNSGSTQGGTNVTVTGTGFLAGAVVEFDGVRATNVSVVSSTSITATTPPHPVGVVNVVVINADAQSGTLANGYTYAQSQTTETVLLQDDFNDNSLNTSKWTANNLFSGFTDAGVPVAEVGQHIEFGPLLRNVGGSHYNGIKSASAFSFTNGYAYVEIVQPGAANTAADAMFTLGNTVNNYYRIYVEGGTLFLQKRINAAKATLLSAPFNAVNDRYWRIRHDAASNSVIFETAPDNAGVPGTWTQRYGEVWSASVSLGTVLFELKGGTWQVEANVPGTVIFDNFKAARQ